MKPALHPRRLAAGLLLALAVACQPAAEPGPSAANDTPSAGQGTQTPALVSFPTLAPSTPAPDLTATLGATLEPSASLGIPVVQLVSPISNTQISISQTLSVVVYAADDTGISRIELTDDGEPVHSENAPSPAPSIYSAIIPWTPTEIGSHVLSVVAYDSNNRASAPDRATVNVTPDTRRPTVVIVYPLGSPQVELGSALQLQAIAIDEVKVTQVDLLVDSQVFTYVRSPSAGGQTQFPIVFSWPALSAGTHTLAVRAHDNQDQTNDSVALKVSV
ncbi:MAG: Ig-like domain-containing protein, partial [Chloroflexi bacterium]|nr:Ig-like domain-containing protein [Chloroflexota bacterium]